MVKRQTVWLSTMMVLSLMLIGYYTMNNGTPGAPGTASVTTTNTTPTNQGGASQTGTNVPATPTLSQGQQPASASDLLVQKQTQVLKELSQREETAMKVIDNSSSSSDSIQTATQDLQQATALQAGVQNAESAVESLGYAQCAVVPTPSGTGATVYVQAKSLTPMKAAEVLDVVSQNTGISVDNIHVAAQN